MLLFNPRRLRWCVLVAAIVGLPFYVPALIDLWVIYDYQPQVDFEPNTWASADVLDAHNSTCQQMVRHLILKVLPGKTREEIERQLGRSPTHEDERRYSRKDLEFREKDEHGEWQPFKRTGHGYCYDEFDWDLIYYIGREHIF